MGGLHHAVNFHHAYWVGGLFHRVRYAGDAGDPEAYHGIQQAVDADMDRMLESAGSAGICAKLLEECFRGNVLAAWLGNCARGHYGGLAGTSTAIFQRATWRVAPFFCLANCGVLVARGGNDRRSRPHRQDGDEWNKFRERDGWRARGGKVGSALALP